ncbi:RNA polymerase sigma factor [Terriglobus sp. TAA 43]|uniref:RNA polymerase sigma factor n=1 Tax=Terriglobus sp. TAA 43 TaxID=278961 RepID=UPI0006467B2C|nr:RNA polymerase sigma factor [Terriglobus sp. TAA 43]
MAQTETVLSPAEILTERRRISAGLRRQDPDLLQELINRYQHRLLRYLCSLTGRTDLAEDLFQETWIRVLERGHLYDDRGDFDAWLFTVARNRALDHFRRRSTVSLDEMMHPDEEGSAAFDPPAADLSPLEAFRLAEQACLLHATMDRLQPIHREVLQMHFYEDLTMREIAEKTGIHMPTVKSRLYRAIGFFEQFLREALTGSSVPVAAAQH